MLDKLDKLELMMMAIEYEQIGEHELALICEKTAHYLDQKEKRHANERSA